MKRINHIYKTITDIDIIMDMYDNKIRRNIKNRFKIEKFDNFYSSNIVEIKEILITKTYYPDRYNIFLIKEPKLRIIMSQCVKDKIVNHLVAKYFLVNVFEKCLIDSNVATRVEKGTHYGLNLMKKYLNNMKNNYNRFYILKFDINKYFYNIDHEIVKKLIKNKIKDKDVLEIIDNIIDSTDQDYVNETIMRLKRKVIDRLDDKDKNISNRVYKEIVNIPIYKKGKGLPIGNMTSQIIATFYLNELDHFVKEKLGIKYYIRYMDDGILIHHDKQYLKYCLKEIKKMIEKYKLELNKKTKIYSSSEPVEFLGFSFLLNKKIVLKLTNKTKKRFKKRMKDINIQFEDNLIDFNYFRSVKDSYIGHLRHGDCNSLIYKNIKTFNEIDLKEIRVE